MNFIRWIQIGIANFIVYGLCSIAQAGTFEVSGTFSYSSNTFGDGNIQWTRRWSASIGYYFWALTEIELATQDVLYRTRINGVEDTTFHDEIYTMNWVQSLAPKTSWVQPYFKAGIGQLYRSASGTYTDGNTPPAIYDSLTGVLGAGLRIFILHTFSLKVEGSSYLAGAQISTWKDNFAVNAGFSFYF